MDKKIIRKNRQKRKTSHFLSKLSYQGENDIPTSIELLQYDSKQIKSNTISAEGSLKKEIDSSFVNWFKITGISDVSQINRICREFDLHSFDVKDLLSSQPITKVVVYKKVTFILMPGFSLGKDGLLNVFQIGLILGSNYVVSIQEAPTPIFDEIIRVLNDPRTSLRQSGADFLLYVLLNGINGLYINTTIGLEDHLFDIEDKLIAKEGIPHLMSILRMRRIDYVKMKRTLVSLREEFDNLLFNGNKLIKESNIVYFNDYDDKLRASLSDLETCHELLLSLTDTYYNNNNMRLNEIMKRLTLVSTIFIPLTFMVGVWGMNFKFMPELELKYGYLIAWGTFIGIVLIVWFLMKKKNWF